VAEEAVTWLVVILQQTEHVTVGSLECANSVGFFLWRFGPVLAMT
jgi:hypothetical protein